MMMHEGLTLIEKEIKGRIESNLERAGLLYRTYSRIKSQASIHEKIVRKGYFHNGKKIQDAIGIRIMTYFGEDVELLVNYFSSLFEVVCLAYDEPEVNQFNPVRINLVCRLEEKYLPVFEEQSKQFGADRKYIDPTFEIQVRTVFSDGWHEIDHFMRYKCKEEWNEMGNESRLLNGIYATLDTTDKTLLRMFDEIAYKHYKNREWTAMIRNKFRLTFEPEPLSPSILSLFNRDKELAKSFLKADRCELMGKLLKSNLDIDITFTNLVFFCNYLQVKDDYIQELIPISLLKQFEELVKENSLYKASYRAVK